MAAAGPGISTATTSASLVYHAEGYHKRFIEDFNGEMQGMLRDARDLANTSKWKVYAEHATLGLIGGAVAGEAAGQVASLIGINKQGGQAIRVVAGTMAVIFAGMHAKSAAEKIECSERIVEVFPTTDSFDKVICDSLAKLFYSRFQLAIEQMTHDEGNAQLVRFLVHRIARLAVDRKLPIFDGASKSIWKASGDYLIAFLKGSEPAPEEAIAGSGAAGAGRIVLKADGITGLDFLHYFTLKVLSEIVPGRTDPFWKSYSAIRLEYQDYLTREYKYDWTLQGLLRRSGGILVHPLAATEEKASSPAAGEVSSKISAEKPKPPEYIYEVLANGGTYKPGCLSPRRRSDRTDKYPPQVFLIKDEAVGLSFCSTVEASLLSRVEKHLPLLEKYRGITLVAHRVSGVDRSLPFPKIRAKA